MSSEIPLPPEFTSNPSGKEVVRQALETMSIGPEMMHPFARETMQGAELLGTNLTIDVRKKVSNPELFSYDFIVEGVGDQTDGPDHRGYAKIFVATEGVRPVLTSSEEGAKAGAVNMIIREVLKNHQKGMASIDLESGDDVVTSKAGKLGNLEKNRLAVAEQAAVNYLLERIAGPTDPVNQEAALDVAKWVGGGAGADEGRAVISDIADRMAPLLTQVVELTEQNKE